MAGQPAGNLNVNDSLTEWSVPYPESEQSNKEASTTTRFVTILWLLFGWISAPHSGYAADPFWGAASLGYGRLRARASVGVAGDR